MRGPGPKWYAKYPKTARFEGQKNVFQTATDRRLWTDIERPIHSTSDNTRPRLRLLVVFFYGVGFTVLAIPTIITFTQLMWYLVR